MGKVCLLPWTRFYPLSNAESHSCSENDFALVERSGSGGHAVHRFILHQVSGGEPCASAQQFTLPLNEYKDIKSQPNPRFPLLALT